MENWRRFTKIIKENVESEPPEENLLSRALSAVAPESEQEQEIPDSEPEKPLPPANKSFPIVDGRNFMNPLPSTSKVNAGFYQSRGPKPSDKHGAIDQNVSIGTPCVAVASGVVVESINQVEYDKNCSDFINIMKKEVFGFDPENKKEKAHAARLIFGTKGYANRRKLTFWATKLWIRLTRNQKWKAKALEKLNSVSSDWNGIRKFQDFLTSQGHKNFCAMFMRHLLRLSAYKERIHKRMMAGKYVNILTDPDQRGRQWQFSYMHMDKYNVNNGDRVEAGQIIGSTGTTGIADDPPHLHFVMRRGRNGRKVDPTKYFPGLR